MFIAFLFGIFLGGNVVETVNFQACKAQDFKSPVCKAKLDRCERLGNCKK